MTDTPKTLSLGAREWNVLLAHNATELVTFFNQQPMPSAEAYKNIIKHMERMKEILPGWLACAPPPAPDAANQAQIQSPPAPQTNGQAPQERKKGGWPLGKKRTRKAAVAQVQ